MDRRLVGALLLATAILLAGCGGASSSPAETQTPAQTTEPESRDFPTGFDEHGIADPTLALANHNDSLRSTGLIVHVSYDGPEQETATNITYKSSVRSESLLMNCSSGCLGNASGSSHKLYVGQGRLFRQVSVEGRIVDQRNVDSPREHETLHRNVGVVGLLGRLPTRNASTVETLYRNNTTHYRYVYNNSTLVVRESGLIESFEDDGDLVRMRVSIRPAPGLRIEAPRWTRRIEPDEYGSSYGNGYDDDTASGGCGTNDGDPSYDEDNDRDNDGLCDES